MTTADPAAAALRERVERALAEQYTVEGELGRGGMGAVYQALDTRLRRRVAVKVLPPELAFDPSVRERFMREAQMAAQLSHPNIVPIYSVDERDGVTYFVMSLVDGESVGSILERGAPVGIERARRILADVADALAYAHARGVVHRDIKPDNILVDRESGRPLVTDFGIARAVSDGGTRLTATGIAVGTPAYMSPEQAVGERDIDARSDVYSLGVVGYHMLAGRPPFEAANTMGLLMKQLSEEPPPLESLRPDAPPEMLAAIGQAMRKAPEERWQSAGELRDALVGAVDVPSPPAKRAPASARKPEERRAEVAIDTGDVDRKKRRKRGDSLDRFAALPMEERIRKFRVAAIRNVGTVGGLATINLVTSPEFLWFLIPGAFMFMDVATKFVSLWSDGVSVDRMLRDRPAGPVPAGGPPKALPGRADGKAAKLAPAEILDGPMGAWVHRAATDHEAIEGLIAKLGKADRERLPDVEATAKMLLQRVASLARLLHALHGQVEPDAIEKLDARIAELRGAGASADSERRLALLERQRGTVDDLLQRRRALMSQLESAALALENLKFDLVKLRSAGFDAGLADVRHATQEARALSAEIGRVLEAVEEVQSIR